MRPKHEKYYQEMIDTNNYLFFKFQEVHDKYLLSGRSSADLGKEVMPAQ